jgi:hypothetical protein
MESRSQITAVRTRWEQNIGYRKDPVKLGPVAARQPDRWREVATVRHQVIEDTITAPENLMFQT